MSLAFHRAAWLNAELSRYTYKPGWTFRLLPRETVGWEHPSVELEISFRAPDSRAQPGTVPRISEVTQVTMLAEAEVERFREFPELFRAKIRHLIITLEMHEMDEWLRYDGELVSDPHAAEPWPAPLALADRA